MNSSALYVYVRGRQLEGTFPGDNTTGCWNLTGARVMKGWGMIDEDVWPYLNQWPPVEPTGIDELAKQGRIFTYTRARSIEDCKMFLFSNHPISAGFVIDDSWFDAPGGFIPLPTTQNKIIGGHAVVLCGYKEHLRCFVFRNSWGQKWGDRGYGYLPYEYLGSRFVEAWTIGHVNRPKMEITSMGIRQVNCAMQEPLGNVLHCIEIIDEICDEIIGWSFALDRDGHFDIEELFVRPQWRRQGYGRLLAMALVELSITNNQPLRLWISHADANSVNSPQSLAIIRRLGLTLCPAAEPWASAVGLVSSTIIPDVLPFANQRTDFRMMSNQYFIRN